MQRAALLIVLLTTLTAAPVLAGCPPGTVASPASLDGVIRPALAQDVNPAGNIVEVFLTAREAIWDFGTGNMTEVFTYNGVIPGPMIEANIGDTLIVNLCNDLPVDTTIHWHGVETPSDMDGSHISQLSVPPGGTFRYEFPLLVAGTFWYHPHIQTNVQVEKGLYGALIVHDPVQDQQLGLPTNEHVFMLDDIWLDANGQVRDPFIGTKQEVAIEMLNGREGDTQLFNGLKNPDAFIEQGIPHRVRVLNVANARFMRMAVQGIPFWRIGGDQGLIEHAILVPPADNGSFADVNGRHPSDPDPTTGLLLSPAERADIVFVPQADDPEVPMRFEWHDTQRGRHSVDFLPDGSVVLAHNIPDGTNPTLVFARLFATGHGTGQWTPPDPLTTLEPIDTTDAPTLPLVLGHTIPDWNTGAVTFFVQGVGMPFDVLGPDDVHTVNTNETYIWEVKNLTGSHHNFHTHGWSFQHIETEFVDLDTPDNNYIEPATHLENKDTILIKRRPGTVPMRSFSIARLAVYFRDTGREGKVRGWGKVPTAETSGGWLAHCHILEHSSRGMMTFFQISELFQDGFESGDTSAWSASTP